MIVSSGNLNTLYLKTSHTFQQQKQIKYFEIRKSETEKSSFHNHNKSELQNFWIGKFLRLQKHSSVSWFPLLVLFRLCPQLSGCILFAPLRSTCNILHNVLPCNDTCSVIGGSITYLGHKRKRTLCLNIVFIIYRVFLETFWFICVGATTAWTWILLSNKLNETNGLM